ncbi:MAG: hypothetical protein ACRDJB_08680 [Actinomycetota bacterium]
MSAFDPRRILEVLHAHEVDYVLVGGLGGALHGSPLPTLDVDIVPSLEKSNLDRLADALNEMETVMRVASDPFEIKLEFTGRSLQKWLIEFRFLNLATRYGRLDLIERPAGTAGYRDLAPNASGERIGDFEVRLAALEDIIRSKSASDRERDRQQLPTLRRLLERKRPENS